MQCWNCMAQLEEGATFCGNCGTDVGSSAPESGRALCGTCGKTFALPKAKSTAPVLECPECRQRREAAIVDETERKEREREKFANSTRSGMRSQRSAERFEVAKCFVRVSRLGLTATLLRKNKPKMGPLIDLSRTGLQCEAEGDFAKDDKVGVHLLVPAFKEPLNLRGHVRWADIVGVSRCRIGVEFDRTDEKTLAHLDALEKHAALRDAAVLREKKASTGAMKKVPPGDAQSKERPADF